MELTGFGTNAVSGHTATSGAISTLPSLGLK